MCVAPTLGRLNRSYHCKSKDNLCLIVSSRLPWDREWELASKCKENKVSLLLQYVSNRMSVQSTALETTPSTLKRKLFVDSKFHIMNPSSMHLSLPHCTLCSHNSSTPIIHTQTITTKTKHRKHLIVGVVVCQCVPQYICLSIHLHFPMFIVTSHWFCPRSLASVTALVLDAYRCSS